MNKKVIRYGSMLSGAVVVILLLVWLLSSSEQKAVQTAPVVENVEIAAINPTEVDDYFEASGVIKANNTSEIASRIMGTINTVSVYQGQKVSAGQELITIDNKDLTQRLNAAKAACEEAAKALAVAKENKSLADITFNRYSKLADQKAVSGQEFDQVENKKKVADLEYARAEMQLSKAQSAYEEAKVNSGFAVISAPSDGLVTGKFVDAGSMATPGTVLLTVEDTTKFKVEANVDERLGGSVRIGTPLEIVIDSIGATIGTSVSEIVPAVDPQARSFVIKAMLPMDSNLRSGLYARVLIPITKKTALVVPTQAIVSKGQLTGVYVADGNAISYRLVRTGKKFGNSYEVLAGLSPGERVIVKGAEHAIDGGAIVSGKI